MKTGNRMQITMTGYLSMSETHILKWEVIRLMSREHHYASDYCQLRYLMGLFRLTTKNIKALDYWPFVRETNSHSGFPTQRVGNAEKIDYPQHDAITRWKWVIAQTAATGYLSVKTHTPRNPHTLMGVIEHMLGTREWMGRNLLLFCFVFSQFAYGWFYPCRYVNKPGHHWFRLWLVTWLVPSHYWNKWWFPVNLTIWKLENQNTVKLNSKYNNFHSRNAFENVDHNVLTK